jgi:hypothetical protein
MGLEVQRACAQTGFSRNDEKKPIMSQLFSRKNSRQEKATNVAFV